MYPHMRNNPQTEADFFLSKLPILAGDMLVLDWEGYDSNNIGLTYSQMNTYKTEFINYLKTALPHVPVGVYCNLDYANNSDKFFGDFLWIADPSGPMGEPNTSLPWKFHQYSSSGNIDHDYSNFATKQDLINWINSFGGTMALTEQDVILIWSYMNKAVSGDTMDAHQMIKDGASTLPVVNQILAALEALTAAVDKLSTPTIDPAVLATDVATDLKADIVTALSK